MIAKFFSLIGMWLCELMVLDQSGGMGQAVHSGGDVPPVTVEGEDLSQPTRGRRD